MWLRMIPPWPVKGRKQVLRSVPSFLNNAFQAFDFIIVCICIIDTLIFAQLRRAGLLNMDPSVFSAVRIFRLVRLAKLLRIFKVFPQLQRLLYVIMSTARLVLFTMLIMLIVLYMFAILMIVCYGDTARVPPVNVIETVLTAAASVGDTMIEVPSLVGFAVGDYISIGHEHNSIKALSSLTQSILQSPLKSNHLKGAIMKEWNPHYHYFGGLLNAMLSGWQLLTFDDWDTLFDLARKDYPLTCAFVFLPTMVGGLMLMNMAVGVMCASAVSLVTRRAGENQYEALLVFISAMGDLVNLLQTELNTQTLLQEMIEAVLDISLRPKKTMHDSRHEGALMKETSQQMIDAGMQPDFVDKLRRIFQRAKLQPVMIKHVFEKVDYERQGFVHVNTFIIGALILKEDLAKLDVFASSTALRHMRSKCLEVCHKLVLCHNKMEVPLQEMCCLIYRDDYDEKMSKKPVNTNISKDFFRLGPEAREALRRLAEWRGEGPLPTLKSMGRMNTMHGTGKLRNMGMDGFDESSTVLEGRSTQLRKEVDFGDIIILEQTSNAADKHEDGGEGGHTGGDRKVVPLPVTAVLSDTMVKVRVDRNAELDKNSFEHFFIVRNTAEEKHKSKAELAATLVQVPKAHFEPTVSQAVFEWDLSTKMKLRSKLEELEESALAEMDEEADQSMSHGTKERIVELQQQENATLLKHYQGLQQKVVYLIDRSLVFRHYQAWKQAWAGGEFRGKRGGPSSGLSRPMGAPVGLAPLPSTRTTASMMDVGDEGAGAAPVPVAADAAAAPSAGMASSSASGVLMDESRQADWRAHAPPAEEPSAFSQLLAGTAPAGSSDPALAESTTAPGGLPATAPAAADPADMSDLRMTSGSQELTGNQATI